MLSGMTRTRLSTTVDQQLLDSARRLRSGLTDAALVDEALEALLRRHRSAEVDASYAAYDEYPIDSADEWGNLASFQKRCRRLVIALPARGEVWWCGPLPEAGRRPVVVLSRDAAIPRLRRALVAPCTNHHPRLGQRGHPGAEGRSDPTTLRGQSRFH